MASTRQETISDSADKLSSGLRRLAVLPDWLLAPLQAKNIAAALERSVPEFASGALKLRSAKAKRLHLQRDDGRWEGTYQVAFDGADGKQTVAMHGVFPPASVGTLEQFAPTAPFGAPGWQMTLPELGLELELEPAEHELPALPILTDPERSRQLLQDAIRADSPVYADMDLVACQPDVLSYKPGSRCTIRYDLTYSPLQSTRGWPTSAIAKTYRKESKGRNAYDGMVLLWHSPLAQSDAATIAEPLAYIPEHKVMVQGPIAGDRSLEDVLKAALKDGSDAALAEVEHLMRKAAAALAAFHRSGVQHGETVTLDKRYDEIDTLIARLLKPVPELAGASEPLLNALRARVGATPADALVPTHGTFSPEQVLLDGDHVGLIDFDDFCMAEPAFDVGLYLAAIRDIGMNALDSNDPAARIGRLETLDRIGEAFLAEYEQHAPISRARVALWEAWSYFRDTLHYWIKVKPNEPDNGLQMLTHHLQAMGILRSDAPQSAEVAV